MKPKQFYNTPAWRWLSRYVKLYHSQDGLIVACMTCNRSWMPVKDKNTHAGHLIKFTDSKSVCLEFENVGVQCYRCNRHQGGKQDILRRKLSQIHGLEAIDKLYIQKNNFMKLDKFVLDYYAQFYKEKFDQLLIERNIKDPWR